MAKRLLLICVVLVWFVSANSVSFAQSNNEYIYYQSDTNLYRLASQNPTPELIASSINSTIIFSNSGIYGAFQDRNGIWLSNLDSWKPKLIITPLPSESFTLYWTPDDSRLIVQIWGLPENVVKPLAETLAYNIITTHIETWPWGDCNTLVRQIATGEFALLCQTYQGLKDFTPKAVLLKWGGQYETAYSDSYQVVVPTSPTIFPNLFDWSSLSGTGHVVYIAPNPSGQNASSSHPFWELVSDWEKTPSTSFESKPDPSSERLLAVAPNQERVAYSVRCNKNGETGVCLQIVDLGTKDVLWNSQSTFYLPNFFDIDWYSDSERVVVLGGDTLEHSIYIFDAVDKSVQKIAIGQSTGIIAIS